LDGRLGGTSGRPKRSPEKSPEIGLAFAEDRTDSGSSPSGWRTGRLDGVAAIITQGVDGGSTPVGSAAAWRGMFNLDAIPCPVSGRQPPRPSCHQLASRDGPPKIFSVSLPALDCRYAGGWVGKSHRPGHRQFPVTSSAGNPADLQALACPTVGRVSTLRVSARSGENRTVRRWLILFRCGVSHRGPSEFR